MIDKETIQNNAQRLKFEIDSNKVHSDEKIELLKLICKEHGIEVTEGKRILAKITVFVTGR